MNMAMMKVGSSICLKSTNFFSLMLVVTEPYRFKLFHVLLILASEIVIT